MESEKNDIILKEIKYKDNIIDKPIREEKEKDINYKVYHMGYNNIKLSDITKKIKFGDKLRVVIYNPYAEVKLGNLEIKGKLEIVTYKKMKVSKNW